MDTRLVCRTNYRLKAKLMLYIYLSQGIPAELVIVWPHDEHHITGPSQWALSIGPMP
jgi:hypothetical protein